MGKGRPAVDPRWACPELGQANDLVLRLNVLAEVANVGGVAVELIASTTLQRLVGAIQSKLLAADAAFQELQAKGGGQ